MFKIIACKIFGTANDRYVKSIQPLVKQINDLEKNYITLSDGGLREQTKILKLRLEAGESLNDILPNAFAVVREAAKRVLGQRHFDAQLMGGIILHRGMIAEMKTGEGKTLVATLPSYLNALTGKGVHVVTVNDYLAKRDADWMGGVHRFLGLTVGCVLNQMEDDERKKAYECDITYGTNSEFGFDYLRDNMKFSRESMVQRDFNYAIVDEVDSILIDEARTPLIISGQTDDNSQLYYDIDRVVKNLDPKYYTLDEKDRIVSLNEEGTEYMEQKMKSAGMIEEDGNLYDIKYVEMVHHLNQALKAHKLFKNEVDYIVRDGKIYIVDEFTGRVMEGRRFSEGLHQALEAKEAVKVQNENQTLASITYQNYFRMFPKLSGMTGTALTEAPEFQFIYGLRSIEVPTNRPIARKDEHDAIYKTANEKYKAIIAQIEECVNREQPALVGTASIEKSELLSDLLRKKGIKHQVLNAKYHEREAKIIAQAGVPGAVTIATNMAGRGTDIMLGGNAEFMIRDMKSEIEDESERGEREKEIRAKVAADKEKVLKSGGLYILGTERHESRRIDNQLRGRSGRQGDPGASKFFLSLEDDLMRIFGSDKLSVMLSRMGLKDDEAIVHPWISKALEKAQMKVENMHYEMRKNVLKYDDIVNEQRKIIFDLRKDIMNAATVRGEIEYIIEEKNNEIVERHVPPKSRRDTWDLEGLSRDFEAIYGLEVNFNDFLEKENPSATPIDMLYRANSFVDALFIEKDKLYGDGIMRQVERQIYLMTLDKFWKDHLYSLDKLRQGINFRAYAQKDPLVEYKMDAFNMFENLLYNINTEVIRRLSRAKVTLENVSDAAGFFNDLNRKSQQEKMQDNRQELLNTMNAGVLEQMKQAQSAGAHSEPIRNRVSSDERDPSNPSTWGKVGRNDPCPCGSNKKYKQCCGMGE